jgi:hypothetical protein
MNMQLNNQNPIFERHSRGRSRCAGWVDQM